MRNMNLKLLPFHKNIKYGTIPIPLHVYTCLVLFGAFTLSTFFSLFIELVLLHPSFKRIHRIFFKKNNNFIPI